MTDIIGLTNHSGMTCRIFNGHTVRFIIKADGVWFIAKDLAELLGLANIRDSINKTVPARHRGSVAIGDGTGGNPNHQIISESGLYRLLFSSRKPEAERFVDWVTDEVLPAIRRQGFYAANGVDPNMARVEQGRQLLTEARLLRQKAAEKAREAKLLLDLENCVSVDQYLCVDMAGTGIHTRIPGGLKTARLIVRGYAKRNNIPTGIDRDGFTTYPREALKAALSADQTWLNLDLTNGTTTED